MLEWPSTWTGSPPQGWPRIARWPPPARARPTIAIVFAGIKHDDDEYAGVLSAVRRTLPGAAVIGCSATGVLTGAEEVENANAVAVLVLGGEPPLPTPLFLPGVRDDPRVAGAKLGQRVRETLGGDVDGAAVAVLVDPAELDAADFVAGIADAAPESADHRRGRLGRRGGLPRVLGRTRRTPTPASRWCCRRELHPSLGMTQGCQALGDPLTITAAEGNLILEIEGRPAVEALERTLSDPRHPGPAPDDAAPARRHRRARLGRPIELRRAAVRGRRRRSRGAGRRRAGARRARRSASRCATRSARATT